MAWTGDVIADINDFLRNRYDMSDVQSLRTYQNPVLERIRKVKSAKDLYAYATGRGVTHTIQTAVGMNATGRTEAGDFPYPQPSEFKQLSIREVQYAATTGITYEEQQEAKTSQAAVANLVDIKLKDLKDDLRFRLNRAFQGDGTGRLASVGSMALLAKPNPPGGTYLATEYQVITVNNTDANFGWADVSLLVVGMPVDCHTPSNSGAWITKFTGGVITAINASAKTVTVATNAASGPNGASVGSAAASDVLFLGGSLNFTSGADTWATITAAGGGHVNECRGLINIVDDGSSNWASTNAGSRYGADYFGLTRTSYPMMQAAVTNMFSGGNPVSWDLEDVYDAIAAVDYGTGGGKVNALYCHPTMQRAIARKAFTSNNTTVIMSDRKTTPGYQTQKIDVGGRTVDIVPMWGLPPYSIYGVCEADLVLYMPEDINFVNPYTGGKGNSQVFFGAPGARNLTFEAWIRWVGQLYARRCDNCFRIDGLRNDE
jgi:hypothetical protein